MPRTADHPARQRQITDGVRRVALESGLGKVTVAAVALEAGVSVGLVQHYYPSKDELLAATLRSVLQDIASRRDEAIALAERRHARIEHMMGDALLQLLPLDEPRREETYLRHAFAGLALDNAGLGAHQQRFNEEMVARAATAISNGVLCGETAPGTDGEVEAHALLALVDGLAAQLLVSADTVDRARARRVVSVRMAALFPGACSRA